jgi:hypothetical protein
LGGGACIISVTGSIGFISPRFAPPRFVALGGYSSSGIAAYLGRAEKSLKNPESFFRPAALSAERGNSVRAGKRRTRWTRGAGRNYAFLQ